MANLRYIQSIHEPLERRNPDTHVRHFLPLSERWRMSRLGRTELAELRATPFYYYLLARTRYYDDVLTAAVSDGIGLFANIGCGTDTRAYRFRRVLRSAGVTCLECDQAEALDAKRRMIKWRHRLDNVAYLPIDLNDGAWPPFEERVEESAGRRVFVMMEGVSPYIDESSFALFLHLLGRSLPAGSRVAYDFKVRGVNDDFGGTERTREPFRIPRERDAVAAFHEAHGLRLDRIESSAELVARLVPGVSDSGAPVFDEDALIQLTVVG
ncbi:MAG: class I SAM-dependent methyltransferase [Vicinamibacterales bacterium]